MGNFIEITGPRCSGRTASLLRLARDYGYIVVEPTEECAIAAKKTAESMGCHGVCVLSSDEFLRDSKWIRCKYLVDDLDWFLKSIGVAGYTKLESGG